MVLGGASRDTTEFGSMEEGLFSMFAMQHLESVPSSESMCALRLGAFHLRSPAQSSSPLLGGSKDHGLPKRLIIDSGTSLVKFPTGKIHPAFIQFLFLFVCNLLFNGEKSDFHPLLTFS